MKTSKTLKCLMALLVAAALIPGAAFAADWAGVYETCREGVVQVRALAENWSPEDGLSTETVARGSGLYLGDDRVVTCAHLVEDCDEVEVEDASGKVIAVKEVLSDDTIDLSVLILEEAPDAVALTLDGEVGVTDEALAVGHVTTYEDVLDYTALRCGVSGLGRGGEDLGIFSRAMRLIQFDGSLYGGFAGAALFDEQGRVAGMIVLPRYEDEAAPYFNIGPGFAIPAADIAAAAVDLAEYGSVRRPRMGVLVSEVDGPEKALKNWPPHGMAIMEIEEGGPADKAGLMVYDIITEIDGERVHTYNELSAVLDAHKGGDTVHLKVYRCYDEDGEMIDDPAYVEIDLTLEIR